MADRSPASSPRKSPASRPSVTGAPLSPSSYVRRGRELGGTRGVRVPPAIGNALPDSRLLLRPVEVAKTLGISRSKVFELLAARELPSVHIGRSTRVPRTQLEEWIEGQLHWEPHQERGLLGRLQAADPSARR